MNYCSYIPVGRVCAFGRPRCSMRYVLMPEMLFRTSNVSSLKNTESCSGNTLVGLVNEFAKLVSMLRVEKLDRA